MDARGGPSVHRAPARRGPGRSTAAAAAPRCGSGASRLRPTGAGLEAPGVHHRSEGLEVVSRASAGSSASSRLAPATRQGAERRCRAEDECELAAQQVQPGVLELVQRGELRKRDELQRASGRPPLGHAGGEGTRSSSCRIGGQFRRSLEERGRRGVAAAALARSAERSSSSATVPSRPFRGVARDARRGDPDRPRGPSPGPARGVPPDARARAPPGRPVERRWRNYFGRRARSALPPFFAPLLSAPIPSTSAARRGT